MSVNKAKFSVHPVGKTMQEDRTTHTGCSCENMVFVCLVFSHSEACMLFVRGGILWPGFVSLFMGRFWCRFQHFSEGIALLDALDSSHFCC